ncbi:acyl-CoA dehydrogenase [bacterium]|nr:acyl-CoA dehydrogenase [bacterium]
MGNFKINQKDVFFILKDQLDYGFLCSLDRYKDLDEKTLDMLVTEAIAFAKGIVDPLNEIGEQEGVHFENGRVTCPGAFKKVFRQYGEDGWTAAARSPKYGGQGFPNMMRIIINDIMYGACQSFNMAPSLTHGAAHLIESFATDELKDRFVEKMYNGTWSGTMCLTEPNAGSFLANVETMAYREGDHFKIKGTKMFISWGDHDLTDNIIHLVLARIEGAPEGVRGISLFVVPKMRVNEDGSCEASNDVLCGGIEEKMGLHASPTAVLNFGSSDACIGYLCGQENMGLAHMFQMMNQARINTGVSGMSLASTAYQNALEYTRDRLQGRDLAGRKKGNVPIIDHPDVRRMLLWMKANVDGMRSMIYTAAYWSDLALELPDGEKKDRYENLVEFFTPIVKAFCSDIGFRVCETAMQCLGGYGFCRDYPIEQYLRDVKILSLYEGTNGIQSIDLMGRKMAMNDGKPFQFFREELGQFCQLHKEHPRLGDKVRALFGVSERVCEIALELKERREKDVLQWASYTYPALMSIGEVIVSWRLLDLAVIADKQQEKAKGSKKEYFEGKILQAGYYVDTVLPQTLVTMETCLRHGREVLDISNNAF